MAKEPRAKKSRAAGVNLFLKGERSHSQKSAMVRKPYPPGVHGQRRRLGGTEYGQQLLEKQRVRWMYGVSEKQFSKYYKEASKTKGATGQLMLQNLERRLDNVVFRLGLAISRSISRQLVSHGHITVNGRRLNIPSYQVKEGDVIGIREQSKSIQQFEDIPTHLKKYEVPTWLHLDKEKLEGKVVQLPESVETPFNINLVVDYYSR